MENFNIDVKYEGIQYNIRLGLRGHKVVIGGNSGTGKTFLYQLVEIYNRLNEKPAAILYNHNSINNILTATSTGEFTFKNKVVIIDNAELPFERIPSLEALINRDRSNYYLIFARVTRELSVSPNCLGYIQTNGTEISIRYQYKEGAWG